MKWTYNDVKPGNMIRICLGDFYHYGIYISDEEIIQFGPPPVTFLRKDEDIEVCVTDINGFLSGKFLEVGEPERKERKKCRKTEEIIASARARVGERGYNILYNNCEHFAYECMFGTKYCSQTESIRNIWRAKIQTIK